MMVTSGGPQVGLLRSMSHPTMPKIILATDLSANALNAALYAMELYGWEDATYTLLHGYEYLVTVGTSSEEDFARSSRARTERFKEALLAKLPGRNWRIDVEVRPGDLPTVLGSYGEHATPPLIVVMGAEEEQEVSAGHRGPSPTVIQQSRLPVLAVPPGTYYKGIDNILLADDGGPVEKAELAALADVLRRTHARVHVLRMENEGAPLTMGTRPSPVEQAIGHVPHTYLHERGDDLLTMMTEAVSETRADLVVLIHRDRSLLRRILHPSVSVRLSLHAHVPLLILQQGA